MSELSSVVGHPAGVAEFLGVGKHRPHLATRSVRNERVYVEVKEKDTGGRKTVCFPNTEKWSLLRKCQCSFISLIKDCHKNLALSGKENKDRMIDHLNSDLQ